MDRSQNLFIFFIFFIFTHSLALHTCWPMAERDLFRSPADSYLEQIVVLVWSLAFNDTLLHIRYVGISVHLMFAFYEGKLICVGVSCLLSPVSTTIGHLMCLLFTQDTFYLIISCFLSDKKLTALHQDAFSNMSDQILIWLYPYFPAQLGPCYV